MKFGEKIRELRKSRNFTRKVLRDRVGVGCANVSRVQNGRLDFEDYRREH
jgi:transcriptional regulator with XRE-family HTH domain